MSVCADILATGYADQTEAPGQMRASCSCCLIRSNGQNILFDTLGPWETKSLVEKLSKCMIHPDDVNLLVCSHSHPDHIGNLSLFTKASKHFVGTSVYKEDIYYLDYFDPPGKVEDDKRGGAEQKTEPFLSNGCYKVDSNIVIEHTPGHTLECITLIASNCDGYGTLALVGDLFEREADLKDSSIWLGAGSQNADLQRLNRAKIYNKADYILPGHGSLFKSSGQLTSCGQLK